MSKTPSEVKIKRNDSVKFVKDDVYHVVEGKIYFDTNTNMPIGHIDQAKRISGLIFVGSDEQLPEFVNKPQWIEERKCHMIILKK